MHTNTELALLNNKNWLLPSPDREFQKGVAETSPFRTQQKKKKPTKPVNSSFVSIFPLFKLGKLTHRLNLFYLSFMCFLPLFYFNYIIYFGLLIFCCQSVANKYYICTMLHYQLKIVLETQLNLQEYLHIDLKVTTGQH